MARGGIGRAQGRSADKDRCKRGSQKGAGLRVESANEFIRTIFRGYLFLKLIYLSPIKTFRKKQ